MVVIDPISLGVSAVGFGLGLYQNANADNARQQDYLNQVAYQDATSEFNNWQASFNAELKDLNSQYAYWAETLNYNQNKVYSKQLLNYEFARELQQAERVMENRVSATSQYAMTAEALQAGLQERGMQEAVALQQFQYRALQASAAYQAAGQEGKSMDRYVRNFARQAGDQRAIQNVNAKLRTRQYTRDQMSAVARFMEQYNQQDFYVKSPIQEPVMPFAPLPTMVMPPGPTMRGAAPQSNFWMDTATAGLGAANTYMSTAQAVKSLGDGGSSGKEGSS